MSETHIGPAKIKAGFGDIPEYTDFRFETNGELGGDGGHGGFAKLEICFGGGSSEMVSLDHEDGYVRGYYRVEGDWEIAGLIDLGTKLREQYPGLYEAFLEADQESEQLWAQAQHEERHHD